MEPHNLCPRCGSLMTGGRCPACGDPDLSPYAPTKPTREGVGFRIMMISLVAYAVVCVVTATFVGHRLIQRLKAAKESQSLLQPDYPRHNGPVARLDEMKGTGTIYLVQMGAHKDPYSLDDFAEWLHTKYKLDVKVLPPTSLDPSAWNGIRHQYVAEALYAQLKHEHADLAANPNAYLIGFTDADIYSIHYLWRSSFTQRDSKRSAIISSEGMQDTPQEMALHGTAAADQRFQARLRRILLKDVAILYWGLPLNNDPTSLLHDTLDPDIPAEDIYESDIDPARTARGLAVGEPCIFITYSAKQGIHRLPGPLIQGCGRANEPDDDASAETFEVDLRLGLLIDKRTDFYLADTIPIEFQRVTRDGWRGLSSFGMSGTDNYDEFLSSANNIKIDVVHADGGSDNLIREPRNLPILSLVKYVDTRNRGFYEMRWASAPFEHYDLNRFDGAVKTYLPCDRPSVHCFLTGYRSPQGEVLKFERGENRRLMRLTSPHQSSISITYDDMGRIAQVRDNNGRAVRYGYDGGSRLTTVTYSSGEVCSYEYDNTQHLLTFSASPDGKSPPVVLLRNEYQNGLVVKQSLADGSVYSYSYDQPQGHEIRAATVRSPDGRVFSLRISESDAILHEEGAEPGSGTQRAAR